MSANSVLYLVEINSDEMTITLSKYTSQEALQRSVTALSGLTGNSSQIILDECQGLIDKLEWLYVDQKKITYEELSKVIEFYNSSSTDKHLSIESLISGLAVRKKVSKLLIENNINDQVKRALDEIANGI